jgi:hypothetical protein
VRIVHGNAANVVASIDQRFPNGFLRWMRRVSVGSYVRMAAVDLEQLGTGSAVNVICGECPIEVRVVDERYAALSVHEFDRMDECRSGGWVFASADGSLCAQTIHVHACTLHGHRQFFAGDDDKRWFFERFERRRTGACVVIGEGHECETVIAVPDVHVTRMPITVAPIAVGMNVSALERGHIERRVERASNRNGWKRQSRRCLRGFGWRQRRRRTSIHHDRGDGHENDRANRCANDTPCSNRLQEGSVAVHMASMAR